MAKYIGRQLGNYRLIRQLGQGGFADVYLGKHIHLETQAAIKVLHQVQLSNEEVERFRREAITIANLTHPHIIRVLEYGIQESTSIPFLVMEYALSSMRQRYPAGTRLTPIDVLPYVEQLASALEYAHNHKVIHRDVKPENMLLDENSKVKLSDFGIAVVHETSRGMNTLDRFGTPSYMAPEQFQGKPLPASDQYSLGIVVYEWLCGTRPFNGEPLALIFQHESAPPPPMREKVPSLSAAIEAVVMKALAKNPKERYKDILDFAQAFKAACRQTEHNSGQIISLSSDMSRSITSVLGTKGRAKPVAATPPEDSSVIWNVPYRRNSFFTGRSKVIALLHDNFYKQIGANRTQALSGLGGMGKTQVVTEYVYRYHSDYEVILWIRGDTREKMLADIAAAATLLNLQEERNFTEAVRAWLRKHTKWLLVIDNIEDLKLLEMFLPTSSRGHILLTTRNQTTGNVARFIDLDKMTLEEGTLFLLRRTKHLAQDATLQDASPVDLQGAQEITTLLDGLPLALDQAGAYIEETGCSLSNYLNSFQAKRKKLLDRRGGFDFDHPASVTATFSSSFDKVEKISPAALELLRFCAFLHSDNIPVELITDGASELSPVLQPVASDPLLLDATIAILRRFSLVRRHADTNMLSLHPLVQAVLQDGMSERTERSEPTLPSPEEGEEEPPQPVIPTDEVSPQIQITPPAPSTLLFTSTLSSQHNLRDFFIMYTKADRKWAMWVARVLEESEYSVILPPWHLHSQSNIDKEMAKARSKAKRIILILSPDSLNILKAQPKNLAKLQKVLKRDQNNLLLICVCNCGSEHEQLLDSLHHIDIVGEDEPIARTVLIAGVRDESVSQTTCPIFPGTAIRRSVEIDPTFPLDTSSTTQTQFSGTVDFNAMASSTLPLSLPDIEIFFSYSHKDKKIRTELEKFMSHLKRHPSIKAWHDGEIGAGMVWTQEIDTHLNRANIILLLVSQDFIGSNYCYNIELQKAIQRHEAGEARVIPIILHPTFWEDTPVGKLQVLPTGARPITLWPKRNLAFMDVVRGIQQAIVQLASSN